MRLVVRKPGFHWLPRDRAGISVTGSHLCLANACGHFVYRLSHLCLVSTCGHFVYRLQSLVPTAPVRNDGTGHFAFMCAARGFTEVVQPATQAGKRHSIMMGL